MLKFLPLIPLIVITLLISNYDSDYINIGVIDNNSSHSRENLDLYINRLNKYGGVDNHSFKLHYFTDYNSSNNCVAIIDLANHNIITDINKSIHVTVDNLNVHHLNYRLSSVVSDRKRRSLKPACKLELLNVKMLDIVIDSMPKHLNDLAQIRKHVIKAIPNHFYFTNDIESKQTVKVGIAMNKIYNIDMDDLSYDMNFYIWFKWDNHLPNSSPIDIEFINTFEPTFLIGDDVDSKIKSTIVDAGDKYVKYQIIGRFKAIEYKNYALGEQNFPIIFRHKDRDINDIQYVMDNLDVSGGIFSQNIPIDENKRDVIAFDVVDNPSLYLHYTMQYSTVVHKLPTGYITSESNQYSQYNYRYALKASNNSIRGTENIINNALTSDIAGKLNRNNLLIYVILSYLLSIFLTHIRRKDGLLSTGVTHVIWIVNFILIMLMLLSLEFLLSQFVFDIKNSSFGLANLDIVHDMMISLQYFVSVGWWLVPAYYINSAINQFIYKAIEENTNQPIPKVLKLFTSSLVYALALIGIMAYVFDVTTNSLMATSGAFAILFAVLSKVNITNIIAGLGISFAKTFKIGDWVKIGNDEGAVIEMNPRAVKLHTYDNSIVIIPNSVVGDAIIDNMGQRPLRAKIHIEVVPMDYVFIEDVLMDAVLSVNGLSSTPSPFVSFLGQGDSAQIFEIYFYIPQTSLKLYYINKVWKAVWKHCEDNNIIMSTPQREHFVKYV